ncbi:MAG: hypothetical protein ACT4QA_02285 [Panacagrimonas sp.]
MGRFILLPLLAVAWSAGVFPAEKDAAGRKLVCWTEVSGRRACGDSIPPRYANTEKKVHDSTGRVVGVIPAERTPEQRAAQARARKQAARTQREADQQAAYDRALLASYSKPEELAALRDDRLLTLDNSLRLAEKAGGRIEDLLVSLRKTATDHGEGATPRNPAQIAEFEKSLSDNLNSVADLRKQRAAVCSTFDRDIRRFQELKLGTVWFQSDCPAPGTLLPGEVTVDIAGVKQMFDRYSGLARARDPALLDLYALDAQITHPYDSASGAVDIAKLTLDEYRAEVLDYWGKTTSDTAMTFSDLSFVPDAKGGVKIGGMRGDTTQRRGKFHLVVRLDPAGTWKIVSQWSETRL